MSSTRSLQILEVIQIILIRPLTIVLKATETLASTMTIENALTKMMLISGQMKAIMKVICDNDNIYKNDIC